LVRFKEFGMAGGVAREDREEWSAESGLVNFVRSRKRRKWSKKDLI